MPWAAQYKAKFGTSPNEHYMHCRCRFLKDISVFFFLRKRNLISVEKSVEQNTNNLLAQKGSLDAQLHNRCRAHAFWVVIAATSTLSASTTSEREELGLLKFVKKDKKNNPRAW